MIDITSQIVNIAKRMPGIDGRAYRGYPQAKVVPPYITVEPMGPVPELTDADGSVIQTHLTYSIEILATSREEVDQYLSMLADRLARHNMYPTGQSPAFESSNHTYRTSMTFDGLVDRRGHTFR